MLTQPHSGTTNDANQRPPQPTWLLVRGLCRQQQHWGQFPYMFAEQLKCNVICCDIAGTGSEWQTTSPYSITAIMLQLRERFYNQHAGIKRPIHLLGISMGGMICTEWARQFPKEIDAMVFMNTSFKNFSPIHHRIKLNKLFTLIRVLLSSAQQQEQIILQLTSQYHKEDQQILQQWVDYARQQPITSTNALRQLYAASRFSAPKQPPINNILLLTSQQDQLVNPSCSTSIAQQWQCAIHYHPHAGHDLPLDDSLWICQQVTTWLQSLRP
ncbi:MAG: pimeloyl-ACP methyl ester carboxylesterase [Moritella sp.]|jgi:pimeloyl-ACP methyl ester carboxylesterase